MAEEKPLELPVYPPDAKFPDQAVLPKAKAAGTVCGIRLYRCRNKRCSPEPGKPLDFALKLGEPVKCPQCGWDMKHPYLPLLRLEVIHYDPPFDEMHHVGIRRRACDKAVPIQVPAGSNGEAVSGEVGTGVASAVNCPLCKETPEYKAAMALIEG